MKKHEIKFFQKTIGILFIFVLLIGMITPVIAAPSIMTWHLVDTGRHLDWGGSTVYQSDFNYSVNTWNAYKSGIIRKDTLLTAQDLAISDYSEQSTTAGKTNPNGTMYFNRYLMDNYSTTQKRNVYTHELGHALGLGHNANGDVMYLTVSNVTSLSANDKASYDQSYARYIYIGP